MFARCLAACLTLAAGAAAAAPEVFVWTDPDPALGGLSGIEMQDDGAGFLALSDRGVLFTGTVERQNGQIVGVRDLSGTVLTSPDGDPLPEGETDSEGIALGPDGTLWLSFEGPARIYRLDPQGGAPVALPPGPGFGRMQENAALEAVAIGPDGAVWTLPERSGSATRAFPVLRFGDGVWTRVWDLPRRDTFLPVGADFGPDGRLYILERDVLGLLFRSRIRRLAADGSAEAVVFRTQFGDFDNLEGLSVWRGPKGLRATMVADNNFLFLQETQIVEIDLPD